MRDRLAQARPLVACAKGHRTAQRGEYMRKSNRRNGVVMLATSLVDMRARKGLVRSCRSCRAARALASCATASLLGATAWLMLAGAAFAQAPEAPAAPLVGAAALPRDLSPWGMFVSADEVVKAVIVGLALASLVTWTIWLAKTVELVVAKRKARAALAVLASSQSLVDARRAATAGPAGDFLAAVQAELQLSADMADKDGLKERIASRLERIEAAYGRKMSRATGVLATIGATAPFVGLSGTVWGIMNSFIGISKSHTTNLAVVAPGIAEALLATAFGLVAAIPAVVIYNLFARSIAGYRAQLGDTSAEVLRLVSRDLDRRAFARKPISAAAG
jgi:biopolymer transport protein ExbB